MNINKNIKYLVLTALFLLSLSFIYYFSVIHYGGDSDQYYSWIKDIYTNHGSYLSWTTAAGYNQFSIIHIFSFLIGSFSYKSPGLFFFIVNCAELILLAISSLVFIKLTNIKNTNFENFILVLLPGIVIWTMICLFHNQQYQEVLLQATDLYLIFIDSFIIISIGWFIHILNHILKNNKLPLFSISMFILFSLYFSLSTLRFLSNAILTEMILLAILTLNNLKLSKNSSQPNKESKGKKKNIIDHTPKFNYAFKSHSIIIFSILILIFVIGYFGFFMIEPYSTSARFVLRGGEVTTTQAFNNFTLIISDYFNAFTDPVNAILRLIYLFVIGYGFIVLLQVIFSRKKSVIEIKMSEIFSLLALINFICVTLSGLFSHGTVFIDPGVAQHYYELSAIFAFLSIICFITENIKSNNKLFITSFSILIITTIISISYLTIKMPDTQLNDVKLLACVDQNKSVYNLKNGMGDWGDVSFLETQDNPNTRYSIIGARATNLDYNWQRNIAESITNNNFLVYSDATYKQNALNLISSKIPAMNYQEIKCSDTSGIIVFDKPTTDYIDTFRTREQNNSKAWLYITDYGTGQLLWSKMPWNKSFIQAHHEYIYYGSLLQKASPNVSYTVNSDLSVTANGYSQQPILITEMVHTGAGKYYLKANYSIASGTANLVVFNLITQQVIANANLDASNTNQNLEFQLDQTTPIIVAIINNNSGQFKLNTLTLGKFFNR